MYKKYFYRILVGIFCLVILIALAGCSSKKRVVQMELEQKKESFLNRKEVADSQQQRLAQTDVREWEWEISRTITTIDSLPDLSGTVKHTLFVRKKQMRSEQNDSLRQHRISTVDVAEADIKQTEINTKERETTSLLYSWIKIALALLLLFILFKLLQK